MAACTTSIYCNKSKETAENLLDLLTIYETFGKDQHGSIDLIEVGFGLV